MINLTEEQKKQSNGENVVFISKVSQFEIWKAIYDSKIFSRIKLTATAKLVLFGIARHYNPDKEECFPSYSYICDHCGVSKKSIERAIKELVNAKLITYRTQKVNRYRLTGYFFACVNLTLDQRQNDAVNQRQNDAQTNNSHEEIKKRDEFLQNFSVENGSESVEQEREVRRETPSTCGNTNQEPPEDLANEVIVPVERKSPGFAKNKSWYSKKQRAFENPGENRGKGKISVPPTDGGSCRVPSAAETRAYMEKVRQNREENCSPRQYERERARVWYANVGSAGRQTTVGQFLIAKYGGWKAEGGWENATREENKGK